MAALYIVSHSWLGKRAKVLAGVLVKYVDFGKGVWVEGNSAIASLSCKLDLLTSRVSMRRFVVGLCVSVILV